METELLKQIVQKQDELIELIQTPINNFLIGTKEDIKTLKRKIKKLKSRLTEIENDPESDIPLKKPSKHDFTMTDKITDVDLWTKMELNYQNELSELKLRLKDKTDNQNKIIENCRDELLKHLFQMRHINGYWAEAVPKATILELPALMRNTITDVDLRDIDEAREERKDISKQSDKVLFINNHRELCDKAFWNGGGHKNYKTEHGQELIMLARKELCYKDRTYSGDIFALLYRIYEGVVNGKSVD